MDPVIEADNLKMHFRGCRALDGVSLRVQSGSVFALLGENGAGKTTFIKILTGFLTPQSGSCRVLGLDPTRQAQELRQRIGYVSDQPALYDWMQVGEIGWFASAFYSQDYLTNYRQHLERFELPSNRKIKHLSKGQRAKVALSLALSHNPDLLILDEPTSGLDPLVRREFLESMLDRVATGKTVLLSSHQIAEVERVADEIAVIHQGNISVADSLDNLRNSFAQVTVSLEDPLIALPELDDSDVVYKEQEGRQVRLFVKGISESQLAQLQTYTGVKSVQTRNASLDEIYIACVRGSRHATVKSRAAAIDVA